MAKQKPKESFDLEKLKETLGHELEKELVPHLQKIISENLSPLFSRLETMEKQTLDHNQALHDLTGKDGLLTVYQDWIRDFNGEIKNIKQFLFERFNRDLTMGGKAQLAEKLNFDMDTLFEEKSDD